MARIVNFSVAGWSVSCRRRMTTSSRIARPWSAIRLRALCFCLPVCLSVCLSLRLSLSLMWARHRYHSNDWRSFYYETFHIPPLASRKTLRILGEGTSAWAELTSGALRPYTAVEQNFRSLTRTNLAKMPNSRVDLSAQSLNRMQLCCCLISKFIDV